MDGPDDLAKALAVRDGYVVAAAAQGPMAPGIARTAAWDAYFRPAHLLLQENPPPATDAAELARIAPLALTHFDPGRFSAADAAGIAAGVDDARQFLRTPPPKPRTFGAWIAEAPDTGDFGQDYEARARVALGGLAALPLTEAMYLRALDPSGVPRFSGDGTWRLTFPAGAMPPVDAFWSLTMYQPTPDGQYFLATNPIGRYSIGDRTPNLTRNPDGGITIWISRTDPGAERRANWLPAPAEGPFSLTLRAYLPRSELISGAYNPPPVVPAP